MSSTPSTAGDPPRQTPPASPLVTYNGKAYNIASEGTAEILDLHRPADTTSGKKEAPKPQSVFYNPIQQYNRDVSVLAIKAFSDDYAVVQKARRRKRGGQQGKKRKREEAEGKEDAGKAGSKKEKLGDRHLANGNVDGADATSGLVNAENQAGTAGTLEAGVVESEPRGLQKVSGTADVTTVVEQSSQTRVDRMVETENELGDGTIITKQPQFRILDALSATGLRALRYAKEIPMVTSITANDLSASATASIELNVSHNGLGDKIIPTTSNAIEHMHAAASQLEGTPSPYHVVDLDPYGTAAPFLDAAVQALVDGGLLCVTCTDAGVFASVGYLEKTYSQYGGLPLKGAHAHEAGIRLIIHAVATSAARYGLAIEPLLSLSIDFYARVFVRVHRSPAEVKFLASKTMIVYNCDSGCGAWSTQHLARAKAKTAKNGDTFYNFTSALAPSVGTHCEHCGFRTHQAGPMWGGPLHNPHFIERILDMLPTLDKTIYGTIPRMEGMLTTALNETLEDKPSGDPSSVPPAIDRPVPTMHPATISHHPFFFLPSALSRIIHCVSPSDAAMRGALLHLGYRTTRSHTKAGSICTDAPWSVIWEIMREWVRQKSPVKEGANKRNTAGWGIMQHDRSKRKVNDVKEAFRKAAENAELDDVTALRTHLEAALYRLSRGENDQADGAEKAKNSTTAGEIESASAPTDPTDQETTNAPTSSQEDPYTEHIPKLPVSGITATDGSEGTEGESSTKPPSKDTHPSTLKIIFDEALGKEPQGKRMVRYQVNPRPDWGPMNRAIGES